MNRPSLDSPPAVTVITNSRTPAWANKRFVGWCIYLVILCAAFARPLREFATYTAHSDVHSYVLLIPFVTAYLIYIRWRQLSGELTTSWGPTVVLAAVGTGALLAGRQSHVRAGPRDGTDHPTRRGQLHALIDQRFRSSHLVHAHGLRHRFDSL